ncbi:mRNA guanine-7-methyltransferase family member protein [Theileria equi strain WA]|uniref:mRNA guanine-7-methyltransferase family member protein n=1 Tax=Theileria equi strain WA TaxID=1537102 RepID=L0AVY5_THEEQ|nr:mRNA guanine-7-methyltransferase family member protein [Theileria equi strain WA]AFZ79196.1 mRNA guanine-7-methyltransferase family member protein [Theileria equi strain WA]|eukprot:XP_004828862.1 mRNA guanine-7-methyltransferase family member protein [Theileria equi strain WA]
MEEYSSVKRRRASHPTDSGHIAPTKLNNPLLIQGCSIFDKQYNESTVHDAVYKMVTESMEGTKDPMSIELVFQIGHLLSLAHSKNIVLPVETEAILDYDSTKVKFVPGVSTSCLDSLYLNVFTSKAGDSRLVPYADYLEIELKLPSNVKVEDHPKDGSDGYHHSKLFRLEYTHDEDIQFGNVSSFSRNNLNDLIVYRPKSNNHYKVCINSVFPLPDDTGDFSSATGILFRNVRVYRSDKTANVKNVKFQLEIIDQWDIGVNGELKKLSIAEMMKVFYQCFIRQNSNVPIPSFIDFDSAEEAKKKLIQLYIRPSAHNKQLYRQYKKLVECKPNRFDYILSMLESNMTMLLEIFDSNSTESVEPLDYYPNMFGDTTESTQTHYDTRVIVRQKKSIIEALRKSNNLIKRVLIAFNVKHGSRILDLACGRGQDLNKYASLGIKKFMGIDISYREIAEARRRYSSRRLQLGFSAEFHHGNLLDNKMYSMFIRNKKFDVVSIQLAIHYILQDEQSSTFFLEHVYRSLNDNGLFIGSTVCCNQILKGLSSSIPCKVSEDSGTAKWEFGNPVFNIALHEDAVNTLLDGEFDPEKIDYTAVSDRINTQWGLKYHFFLLESIDESEFVVPWKSFVNLCFKIGFRLVQTYTFPEYLEMANSMLSGGNNTKISQRVIDEVGEHLKFIKSYPLSDDQSHVFSLYKIFVFEKITGRDKLYMQGVKIKK